LIFCLISIGFSLVFGTVLALLVGRTNLPARGFFANILLWPIFVSPLIIGFGAILTYGPSGYVSALFVNLFGGEAPWNIYTVTGLSLISGIAMVPMTILYASPRPSSRTRGSKRPPASPAPDLCASSPASHSR
jgi:iron(III) transport system permease protein